MEILNNIFDTIKTLPAYLKALVLVVLICAVLGYTYITKEEPAPEAAPAVQKELNLDTKADVKNGDNSQNFNISQ